MELVLRPGICIALRETNGLQACEKIVGLARLAEIKEYKVDYKKREALGAYA